MNQIILFTDGASKGNPGPGGWGVIVVKSDETITELGGYEEYTTNNKMELKAAIEGLNNVRNIHGSITINTDSRYLIQGITKWIKGWIKNGWITSTKEQVQNRDLWQALITLLEARQATDIVTWNYVAGHVGIPGNERVDLIASGYAEHHPVDLYNGPKKNYSIDLTAISENNIKKTLKENSRNRSKTKAYSYLSMVHGDIKVHKTWAECETRVKGTSGAKFKKALSSDEEKEIINSWKNI